MRKRLLVILLLVFVPIISGCGNDSVSQENKNQDNSSAEIEKESSQDKIEKAEKYLGEDKFYQAEDILKEAKKNSDSETTDKVDGILSQINLYKKAENNYNDKRYDVAQDNIEKILDEKHGSAILKDKAESLKDKVKDKIEQKKSKDTKKKNPDYTAIEDVINDTFDPGDDPLNVLSYQKQFGAGAQFSILFQGTLDSGKELIIEDGIVGYSFCIPITESFDDSEIESIIVDDDYSYDHDDEDGDKCVFSVVNDKIQLLTYDSTAAMHFADNFTIEIHDIFGDSATQNISGLGSELMDMLDNFDIASKYIGKNLYDCEYESRSDKKTTHSNNKGSWSSEKNHQLSSFMISWSQEMHQSYSKMSFDDSISTFNNRSVDDLVDGSLKPLVNGSPVTFSYDSSGDYQVVSVYDGATNDGTLTSYVFALGPNGPVALVSQGKHNGHSVSFKPTANTVLQNGFTNIANS